MVFKCFPAMNTRATVDQTLEDLSHRHILYEKQPLIF